MIPSELYLAYSRELPKRSVLSHYLLPRSLLKLKGCGKHGIQTNSPCSVAHTTFLSIIRCDKHERGQSKGQDTQQSCHTELLKPAQSSVGLLKASHAVGQQHQTCSKTVPGKWRQKEEKQPCTHPFRHLASVCLSGTAHHFSFLNYHLVTLKPAH